MLKVANNPSHGHGGIRPNKIEHIPIVGLLQHTLHDVSHQLGIEGLVELEGGPGDEGGLAAHGLGGQVEEF